MFESFRNRDLKDTGSRNEPGAGAPLVPCTGGNHSGELEEEGAKNYKNIHNEKASMP